MMKTKISAVFLLLFSCVVASLRLSVAPADETNDVTIHGPEVEMGMPSKVPERPYNLLWKGLQKHRRAKNFTVWSGALGSTTQLEYDRRRQTLTASFYLLSEDFHSHWRNVSEATIAAVAAAEKTDNVIWWKNGEFHEVQIEPEKILKKHGAHEIKMRKPTSS